MSVIPSRRTLRRLVVAGLAVTTAIVPLSAQQPQATTPAAPQQAPAGPVLTLTMEQAVQMALETSLGLKSERINVDIASQGIVSARSAFLPVIQGNLSRNNSESQPFTNADGTQTVPTSNNFSTGASVGQFMPWFGGNYSANWTTSRTATGGGSASFNPNLGSRLTLNYTQPLLRDLKIDGNRAGLERAQRQHLISDIGLQQRVVSTEANVRNAYLNLIAALEGKKVADLNMDLAQTSLRNARARVAVGQSPQLDIITAESSVETNRDQVILAAANIGDAEDFLRAQILDQARPDYWALTLLPADQITVVERQVDSDAAIKNALANRLDMVTLRKNIEILDLDISLAKNNTKITLDGVVSYTAAGTGGRQRNSDGSFTSIGFGSVLGDAFGGAYPSWTYGVQVAYPIGRTQALVQQTSTELRKQQQLLAVRDLELQIVGDVRRAARDISSSYQRVQATKAAEDASTRELDAENRKFAVGLTDTFAVQQRELRLAAARVSRLNAMIAYNRALIEFERVQKIR